MMVVIGVLVLPHFVLAAPGDTAPATPSSLNEVMRQVTNFLTLIIEFIKKLIWPVLLMIGALLKNDILFNAGMEDRMLAIWANVRNIVNILFVLVLIGIAFYNIMGLGQEYHLKTQLPKFIIALIAVNFSYLGVKLVIDGVNVMTTAIFALPDSVEQGLSTNSTLGTDAFEKRICEGLYGGKSVAEYEKTVNGLAGQALCGTAATGTNMRLTADAKRFFSKFDGHNAAVVMALSFMNIGNIDKVQVPNPTLENLTLNMLFSALFYIVYTSAFIALFLVLLMRLVALWVGMVLSPLVVFLYILPDKIKSAMQGSSNFSEMFIKNALAPLPIALVMSIGYVMMRGLQISQFSATTLGSETMSLGFFTSGLTTLQEVIIAVGTAAVVWRGVFDAVQGTLAEGMVNGFKEVVSSTGKFIATAPFKYAPIFPMYTGEASAGGKPEMISAGSALGAISQLKQNMEDKERKKTQRFVELATGQKANQSANKIIEAKTPEEHRQAVRNAEHQKGTKQVQEALFRSQRDNVDIRRKMEEAFNAVKGELKDKGGKPYANFAAFSKELEKGEAPEATMQSFWTKYTDGLKTQAEPTPTAGAAQGGGKKDSAGANALLSEPGVSGYEKALPPDQQRALAAYRAAPANQKDKQLADQKTQDALQAIQGMQDAAAAFRDQLSQPNADMDKLVGERRQALAARGISDKGEQNRIIKSEIGSMEGAHKAKFDSSAEWKGGISAATPYAAAPVAGAGGGATAPARRGDTGNPNTPKVNRGKRGPKPISNPGTSGAKDSGWVFDGTDWIKDQEYED